MGSALSWLIPRNRFFNVYLHQILRPDDDRALHDHPWLNCSIVLRGSYHEVRQDGSICLRRRGAIVFRWAQTAHRIIVDRPAWSLFITGPVVRSWGFHCPNGWVHWRDFVAENPGEIGRGCGEQDGMAERVVAEMAREGA
jgi:hypothetical protein